MQYCSNNKTIAEEKQESHLQHCMKHRRILITGGSTGSSLTPNTVVLLLETTNFILKSTVYRVTVGTNPAGGVCVIITETMLLTEIKIR